MTQTTRDTAGNARGTRGRRAVRGSGRGRPNNLEAGLAATVREICAEFGAYPLNMTADDCMEFKKHLPKLLIAEIRKTAKRDGCGICEIIRWTNRKVCLRACA